MSGQTFYINPNASTNGNGSITNPLNTWSGLTLQAGDSYLQEGGTNFNGSLTINEHGNASAPINIGVYGSGQASIGGVVFSGASYVDLMGFHISAPGASVSIGNGSNNVSIENCEICNSNGSGLTILGAGSNNLVQNNLIHDNQYFGIFVGSQTAIATISGNDIYHNGGGGVELEGQNTIVEFNLVQNNGWDSAGYAGIHTYSPSSGNDGSYNTIEYNIVTGQMAGPDNAGPDGEAILLDQWTHNNTVSGNLTNDNAGNGLHVFGGYNNTLSNNASIGDVTSVGCYAELAIGNDGLSSDPTYGNVATNDILVAETAGTVDYYDQYPTQNTISGVVGPSSETTWLTGFENSGAPAQLIGVAQSII